MARSRRRRSPARLGSERRGARPHWPLLGLAILGMGLTGFLTGSAWIGQGVAGCPRGAGCEIVLTSRWATLLGVPTSFWGFLVYATLGGLALSGPSPAGWRIAWGLALSSALYSGYLTAISVLVLEAACPYCLASFALLLLILGALTAQGRQVVPDLSWRAWLPRTVAPALVLVLALHLLHGAGPQEGAQGPEDPRLRALAEHLVVTGAKFYGASWCPHCADQKALFGASAHRLPYVECSPEGRFGPEAPICVAMDITAYPTWIIHGRRLEGVLTPHELARHSGFEGALP